MTNKQGVTAQPEYAPNEDLSRSRAGPLERRSRWQAPTSPRHSVPDHRCLNLAGTGEKAPIQDGERPIGRPLCCLQSADE